MKNEIWSQINDIFDGKDFVCDGNISNVQVEQESVPQNSSSSYLWGEAEDCRGLVTYYKNLSGGFEIMQGNMDRNYNRITIHTYSSSNMGYKVFNDYNPSINDCYQSAFNYMISHDNTNGNTKNGCRAGFYNRIQNISSIANDYYLVGGLTVSAKPDRFLPQSSFIENDYWKVFYIRSGYEYFVAFNYNAKQKDFWKIFGFSSLGLLLLSFVFLYNPHSKKKQG